MPLLWHVLLWLGMAHSALLGMTATYNQRKSAARRAAMARRAALMPAYLRVPNVGPDVLCGGCGHSKAQHSLLILMASCQHCACPQFDPRCQRCGHLLNMHTWAAPGDKKQWGCLCACDEFRATEPEQMALL